MIAATIGVSRSFTSAVTTAPNAAPMTMPTARSTTFPRSRNALKSFAIRSPNLEVSASGRIFAAGYDGLLSALEQRDALDVVRLGKHVDGRDLAQYPAGVDEFGGVRGERGGVAGDINDAF